MSEKELPLWEVFVRSKQGLDHKHCGSLHAADAQMALRMARDVYTRRMEGVSIWVVPSAAITASAPEDKAIDLTCGMQGIILASLMHPLHIVHCLCARVS